MTFAASTADPHHQLRGFITGVWNPEDLVELPGSPWIVVSAMRSRGRQGALLAVCSDSVQAKEIKWSSVAEAGRVNSEVFDPHGVAARRIDEDRYELLVIDHGGGEAVDRLVVSVSDNHPAIVCGERIIQPQGTSGNAVAYLPDGGFVITSMFDPRDGTTLARFARAESTGGVWQWSASTGWKRFGRLALSGANGIAVTPDGSAIIVCEWAAKRVWRLSREGVPECRAETTFLPDNLRWAPDGQLILAGQMARPEAVFGCEARGEPCPLGFQVAALDPASLACVQRVKADEQKAAAIGFGGATGALQIGDALWVGSFTGERIAKFSVT